jgi:hypothetical protein
VSTHNSVAKSVREHKEAHPELYCLHCLWRTGGGPCPRHAGLSATRREEIKSYGMYEQLRRSIEEDSR